MVCRLVGAQGPAWSGIEPAHSVAIKEGGKRPLVSAVYRPDLREVHVLGLGPKKLAPA